MNNNKTISPESLGFNASKCCLTGLLYTRHLGNGQNIKLK